MRRDAPYYQTENYLKNNKTDGRLQYLIKNIRHS